MFLDLQYNKLNGTLMSDFVMNSTSSTLQINNNYLSGVIPEFCYGISPGYLNMLSGNTFNAITGNPFDSNTLPGSDPSFLTYVPGSLQARIVVVVAVVAAAVFVVAVVVDRGCRDRIFVIVATVVMFVQDIP